jgi:hypothetical protein
MKSPLIKQMEQPVEKKKQMKPSRHLMSERARGTLCQSLSTTPQIDRE